MTTRNALLGLFFATLLNLIPQAAFAGYAAYNMTNIGPGGNPTGTAVWILGTNLPTNCSVHLYSLDWTSYLGSAPGAYCSPTLVTFYVPSNILYNYPGANVTVLDAYGNWSNPMSVNFGTVGICYITPGYPYPGYGSYIPLTSTPVNYFQCASICKSYAVSRYGVSYGCGVY
jgi:hypothetical protein